MYEQEMVAVYIEEQTCSLVESGVKYWSCRFCEKYNRDKRDIQRHIEAAHVETSPYICLRWDWICLFGVAKSGSSQGKP